MMMANKANSSLLARRETQPYANAVAIQHNNLTMPFRRSQLCQASSSPQDANYASDSTHPEVRQFDPETLSFNLQHLGPLGERIAQIRKAQALHMLQHRYTPSTLLAAVEESLETRPDMSVGQAQLEDWHHKQWEALHAAMEDAP